MSPRYFRGGTIRLCKYLSALLDLNNTGENYILMTIAQFQR